MLSKLQKLTVPMNRLRELHDRKKTDDGNTVNVSLFRVTRLLFNNPRKITLEDAVAIYKSAY